MGLTMAVRAYEIFSRAASLIDVAAPISGADWADEFFYLPSESSNTSGRWKTATIQRAILNAMCSDAIEKVDFFKPARFGGTKMLIAANAYFIAHKRRNVGFYQPTADDSLKFVKSEIETSMRDCDPWRDALISASDKSPLNTLSFKVFRGCNSYYLGANSANSFRRLSLDVVILDELSGMPSNVDNEGSPTTLSWGRVKNSVFKKQIQISTPTVEGFCPIQKSAKQAQDILNFEVKCPLCNEPGLIDWGGTDCAYGFKYNDRDASTVLNYCKTCGGGWGNGKLDEACRSGRWIGEKGWSTVDGLQWFLNDVEHSPPRHIAFQTWTAYSPFSPWSQIVEEWYDAQGDISKIQAWTNTTLARTWSIDNTGTITAEIIDGLIPVESLDRVKAIVAGIDVQDDRIEVQYVGLEDGNGIICLGYEIFYGDMAKPDVYRDMANDVLSARFRCGSRELLVTNAGMDTQGHYSDMVHKFLIANRSRNVFVGINGVANTTYEIADKPGAYKNMKGSRFFSIGVNLLKQKVFNAIRNHDQETGSFKIWAEARLPKDYSKQLTAEKMEITRSGGLDRVVFTNRHRKRVEALDTLVYAIAMKAYIQKHRGRNGRMLFPD